jgi:hypothetical protein
LNYINEDYGIDVNLTYYCFGERVIEVAVNSTLIQKDQLSVANITEKPRNLVDLVISKTLTKYLSLKASWKDILAEDSIFEQYTSTLRKFQNHSEYSVGLSLNL